jgi:hypothetical protein
MFGFSSVAKIEEKRNTPRFCWTAEIKVVVLPALGLPAQPQLSVRAIAENIGQGGVGILSDHPLAPDAIVRCEFALSDNPVFVPTVLKVRWCVKVPGSPYKVGLQFLL